jgi:DNA-directed RNA polymerase specialized sigma24 family protein
MYETSRSKDALDKNHDSLDDVRPDFDSPSARFALESRIGDKTADIYSQLEQSDLLQRGLGQLRSQLQRQVIKLTYFDERSDEKIAKKLHKTRANVQTLRHRGLVRLSHLLAELQVKESRRQKHKKK